MMVHANHIHYTCVSINYLRLQYTMTTQLRLMTVGLKLQQPSGIAFMYIQVGLYR